MPGSATKKCPFCGERINVEAVKCRFCKEFLEDDAGLPVSNHARKRLAPRPEEAGADEAKGDEVLVAVPSLWGIAGAFLSCIIFFGLGLFLLIWADGGLLQKTSLPQANQIQIQQTIRLSGLGVIFVVGIILAWKIARLKSIRYEISVDRIEWIRGIFSRKIDNIDMFRVVDIKLHRSLLDCIVGIGTLTVVTKDQTTPEFSFEKIRKPKTLYDFIKNAALSADRKQGVIHMD